MWQSPLLKWKAWSSMRNLQLNHAGSGVVNAASSVNKRHKNNVNLHCDRSYRQNWRWLLSSGCSPCARQMKRIQLLLTWRTPNSTLRRGRFICNSTSASQCIGTYSKNHFLLHSVSRLSHSSQKTMFMGNAWARDQECCAYEHPTNLLEALHLNSA